MRSLRSKVATGGGNGERARPGLALLVVAGLFLLHAVVALAAQNTRAPAASAIAARVNDEPIMRAEVQRLLANPLERQQLAEEFGVDAADTRALDRLALRRLIERRLIVQEAARRKFTITDAELDAAVRSLRGRFPDLKQLGIWMKEQGLEDKSLFETIRGEMLAARVRAAIVAGARVAEAQISEYYDAHRDALKVEEVRLQAIVVNDEAAATEILQAIEQGENFATLARDRSVGRRAERGGEIGWVDIETLGSPLRQIAKALQPRQVRGPVRRGDEYLIVRLDDRRMRTADTVGEARAEIERRLLPSAQREALGAWLREREKESTIEYAPFAAAGERK